MSKLVAPAAASRADSRGGANGSVRVMLAAAAALALHVVVLMPMRVLIVSGPAIQSAPSMTVRMVSAATSAVADAHLTAAAAVAAIEALQSPPPASPVVASKMTATSSPTGTASKLEGERRAVAAAATAEAAAASSPAQPPSLPPAPDYVFAGKLDPGPRPLQDIEPIYPVRAGQQQGVVVLRLLIDEQGAVDNVAVVRATPLGYFEEAAVEAFAAARFSPGKLLGVAVKSQVTIEVEFTPVNRGANVSGRTY